MPPRIESPPGTKYCPKCKKFVPVEEFGVYVGGKRDGVLYGRCKPCSRLISQTYARAHGCLPMSESKECGLYLGVYVAERALSKFFDNITRMPASNRGYDFLCGKGFKIDVKSSVLHKTGSPNLKWVFAIGRNTIADYFLCLAFDDRENLTPLHVWLIPGHLVNYNNSVTITNTYMTLQAWSEYEKPLARVLSGCDAIRSV